MRFTRIAIRSRSSKLLCSDEARLMSRASGARDNDKINNASQ